MALQKSTGVSTIQYNMKYPPSTVLFLVCSTPGISTPKSSSKLSTAAPCIRPTVCVWLVAYSRAGALVRYQAVCDQM